MQKYDIDSLWGSNASDIIRLKRESYDGAGNEVAKCLIYFWQRMAMKERTLARMYGLFAHEKKTGRVYKNKFWECAERLGANLTKLDVDKCFKLFDQDGKGYFCFPDFTRVSKLVQGYEIDQLFNHGDKINMKNKGKRCRGFSEREDIEYGA